MNEVAGLGARNRFTAYAPADFADSREHVGDRFLLSVMMNSCSRFRLYFEQAAPDGWRNDECRCDRGATFGARSLCGSFIEFSRADDADCGRVHWYPRSIWVFNRGVKQRRMRR